MMSGSVLKFKKETKLKVIKIALIAFITRLIYNDVTANKVILFILVVLILTFFLFSHGTPIVVVFACFIYLG